MKKSIRNPRTELANQTVLNGTVINKTKEDQAGKEARTVHKLFPIVNPHGSLPSEPDITRHSTALRYIRHWPGLHRILLPVLRTGAGCRPASLPNLLETGTDIRFPFPSYEFWEACGLAPKTFFRSSDYPETIFWHP